MGALAKIPIDNVGIIRPYSNNVVLQTNLRSLAADYVRFSFKRFESKSNGPTISRPWGLG